MEESKTYCLKDSENKHYWRSIGVFSTANGVIREVFKCSQCKKIITEKLKEITLVYQVPNNLKENFLKKKKKVRKALRRLGS